MYNIVGIICGFKNFIRVEFLFVKFFCLRLGFNIVDKDGIDNNLLIRLEINEVLVLEVVVMVMVFRMLSGLWDLERFCIGRCFILGCKFLRFFSVLLYFFVKIVVCVLGFFVMLNILIIWRVCL